MAAQPRQSWSSCDLSGPDTPGPIRPLTPLPRQSRLVGWIYELTCGFWGLVGWRWWLRGAGEGDGGSDEVKGALLVG
ncbi:hypothetical protein OSH64_26880, partial [Mycobacterium ulcerans]